MYVIVHDTIIVHVPHLHERMEGQLACPVVRHRVPEYRRIESASSWCGDAFPLARQVDKEGESRPFLVSFSAREGARAESKREGVPFAFNGSGDERASGPPFPHEPFVAGQRPKTVQVDSRHIFSEHACVEYLVGNVECGSCVQTNQPNPKSVKTTTYHGAFSTLAHCEGTTAPTTYSKSDTRE